jgi:hypothetical protein
MTTAASIPPPRMLAVNATAEVVKSLGRFDLFQEQIHRFVVSRRGVMGVDMRRIIQANIDRLNKLLETETDPTKRTMERRLLVEEKANLKKLPAYNKNEAKAY